MAFVHLHNHTEYSLLDGATHILDMVKRAAELGMPAVAITDHGVMSGVPELAKAVEEVKRDTGIEVKPIFGCEAYMVLEDPPLKEGGSPHRYHLLLLAKDNKGYHNLVRLISEANVDHFYYKPQISLSMLERYGEGLIGTSACIQGIIPVMIDQGQYDEAVKWAQRLASFFAPGDFYIELQDHGITTRNGLSQHELNIQLAKLAGELDLKTIATNDLHYLKKEDAKAQDILLCIGTGKTLADTERLKFPCDEFYFKTEEEMREVMRDFPEACDNTVELAARCTVELERDPILPRFPLPEGETEESFFRKQCLEGLHWRYGADLSDEVMARYEREAGVIIKQGFPAYFLIVQEFINWAKSQDIIVGPGRGSAAGSIVSYALGITDLDPLANGLLFERFLSEERVEMPDIDVDFSDDRRDDVIDHIKEVYGEDHVAGVITFGKLQAKNAVRDAARVLGKEYKVGDDLCKMIGNELNITINEAMEKNPDLKRAYKDNPDYREVIDAARSIEGQVRGEGVHACAHIICRNPLADHLPLKRDKKDKGIITQYDGHYTPDLGLLKMDFLGLRNHRVISLTCEQIKDRYGIDIKPDEIPLDDAAAFELMGTGNLAGLFQVEGPLYVRLFARMKPRQFSDVVAAIALNRPGPLESGMLEEFIARRANPRKVRYYDERLKPILEETYGTMVYQEQVMQVSMVMSGFSAGKSDQLRKAMGKKKIDLMLQLKEDWTRGAVENGYFEQTAITIWDDAESFAKYAFNKSHSAAYAVVVMRTAYLKAHYHMEFMAALLTSVMGNADTLVRYIAETRRGGIPVMAPDVNSSGREFTPIDEGIRFGLAGIRGVGALAADAIIAEREQGGPFTSLHDFVYRIDNTYCNKKVVEALVKSGAFDSTGYTRRQLWHFVEADNLMDVAARRHRDKAGGQLDLFATLADEGFDIGIEDIPAADGVEWSLQTKLNFEKEILKIYVSGHPLGEYADLLAKHSEFSLGVFAGGSGGEESEEGDGDALEQVVLDVADDIASIPTNREIRLAGMVTSLSQMVTKKEGKRMAKFVLEDMEGSIEAVMFPTAFVQYGSLLEEDAKVYLTAKFEKRDRGSQIIVSRVARLDLEKPSSQAITTLELHVASGAFNAQLSDRLKQALSTYPGRSPVVLFVEQSGGGHLRAPMPMTVDSSNQDFLQELDHIEGLSYEAFQLKNAQRTSLPSRSVSM
ncbi:MAG: DNA polymerase III subunit alpha [Coriobacteriales bacterium]|jgi:DNA polymerase-3 subunit alpha|nr:DNA polymerase III subunit alpha [Coriobacteriales bacterium]